MGIPVQGTLDLWDNYASPPDPPITDEGLGGASFYLNSLGQMCITQNGSTEATSSGAVEMQGRRAGAIWFTSETGTPAKPLSTGSPLFSAFSSGQYVLGDYIVRESDGEVFQTSGVNYTITDLGFSIGGAGHNAVTNTIARVHNGSTFNLGSSLATLALNTPDFDPGSHTSASTYMYTCPTAGYYRVAGSITAYGPSGWIALAAFHSGAQVILNESEQNAVGTLTASVDDILQCAAGDTIYLEGSASAAGSFSVGAGYGSMTVEMIAPLTIGSVTPNTGSRAYMSASSQSTSTGGWIKVNINTVDSGDDPGGHWDTVNYQYKVTQAGLYFVQASIALSITTAISAQAFVSKSGTPGATADGFYLRGDTEPSVETWIGNGSGLIRCVAGDTIALYFANQPGDMSVLGGADYDTNMSVVQVDQPISNTVNVTQTTFFYSGAGTPTGISGAQNTNYCIRLGDGEVFQYNGGAWVDQGFSVAGNNAVTNTAARLLMSAQITLAANGWTKMPLNVVDYDYGGCTSTTNNSYTAPTAGVYDIDLTLATQTGTAPTDMILSIYVNGVEKFRPARSVFEGTITATTANAKLKLNAGDVVTFEVYNNSANTTWVADDSAVEGTAMAIHLIAPLTNAPVTPNTASRAYRNAALTTGTGVSKVPLDTVATGQDPGSHFSSANNRINISASGTYQVNANIYFSMSPGYTYQVVVYKNGAQALAGESVVFRGTNGDTMLLTLNDTLQCSAGDYLELWAYSTTPSVLSVGYPYYNMLSVVKVDQPAQVNGGGAGNGNGVFTYAGTGIPTGITGMSTGSLCIRLSDSEVFQYNGTTWIDQGFSFAGVNAVSPTVARAYRNAAMSALTASTWTKVPLDTATINPSGYMDVVTNNRYNVANSGYYQVNAQAAVTDQTDAVFGLAIYKNGSVISESVGVGGGVSGGQPGGDLSDIIQCNAGDYLELWIMCGGTSKTPITGNPAATFMSVSLLAPLTTIPVAPNTGARAYKASTSPQTLTASTFTKVLLDTIATGNDPGGHFDAVTNHRYNVTSAGWYQVNAVASVNSTAVNAQLQAGVYHNGSAVSYGSNEVAESASSTTLSSSISDLIYCAVGDYLELWAYCSAAYVVNASPYTYMSVVKADQPVAPTNGAWQSATVVSPWSEGQTTVQYMKDANGFVHIRGSTTAASVQSSSIMFTLPAGYRPGVSDYFPAVQSGGASALIYVETTGQVYGTISTANNQLRFNGTNYLAEN